MTIEEYLVWHSGRSSAPLSKQLQVALKSCDKTIYAIAQESGVSAAIIQRFLSGERGITLDTAGRLAQYLGLSLWPDAQVKSGEK
jgi:plasmid maintenance system antidote protein VapI